MTIRRNYLKKLDDLQHEILRIGCRVEEAVKKSIEALKKQDIELARQVIEGDIFFDDMEIAIENRCVELIATEQPVARDLRIILTALKTITDLERIADYAEGIAKIAIHLKEEVYIKPLIDIPRMAELAVSMVNESIDAYVNLDANKAEAICIRDDIIDNMYSQMFEELLQYMEQDSKNIKQATHFLFVCKYLERIADHATNLCQWVIYIVTGERKELNN